ncbi:GerMN domain-containing protein [Streptomyces sp. NPDC002454]|uniref:hypothetical protein n=1 Tax=unclassified Streptomyces TaxID=2593676 RepID=UPI00331BBF03
MAVAVAALFGAALTGCGVQPTGVVEAGEPATGLTRGMRLYFASETGLRAVPLLGRKVEDLAEVVKLLAQGPPPGYDEALTTLVHVSGTYEMTGRGTRVTMRLDGPHVDAGTGQLVCTLARAQAVLEPGVRADEVEVTIEPDDRGPSGPHRCADFLDR